MIAPAQARIQKSGRPVEDPSSHAAAMVTRLVLGEIELLFPESDSVGILPVLKKLSRELALPVKAMQPSQDLQSLVASAAGLFNRIAARIENLQAELDASLQDDVREANALTRAIAGLAARGSSGDASREEMRIRRQALVAQLSEIVALRDPDSESPRQIVIGNNRTLTLDGRATPLSLAPSCNTDRLMVQCGNVDITSELSGGRMKARIHLRDEMIPAYLRHLDRLAFDVAAAAGDGLFKPLESPLGAARTMALSRSARATRPIGAFPIDSLVDQYRALTYLIGSDAAIAELTVQKHEALARQTENCRRAPADLSRFERAREASAGVERAIDELLQIALTIGV